MSETPEENAKETKFKIKDFPKLIKKTGIAWNDSDPWRLSAVVAYYALLSLPGLLVVIINGVGYIWGTEIVAGKLNGQISSALGSDAAESIQEMFANTRGENKGLVSTIIGIATLLFGATGVFFHLQISLNQIWGIKTNPEAGIKKIVIDRAQSFAFVLAIAFLLLTSFVITAGIAVLNDFLLQLFPDAIVYAVEILNEVISVGIITVLFGLIFRYLPDAKIRWKTVWFGSFLTAILFIIGKILLSLYFGKANPGSTYGAAGSVILILLWVSYSCLILFFGAEFTKVYADTYGHGIEPDTHAVRYRTKIIEEIEN